MAQGNAFLADLGCARDCLSLQKGIDTEKLNAHGSFNISRSLARCRCSRVQSYAFLFVRKYIHKERPFGTLELELHRRVDLP
jgi:hypothetical protein